MDLSSIHPENSEGKKPFLCKMCDKSFTEKRKLKRHIESVHERFVKPQTDEKVFSDPVAALATCLKCNECNYLFKNKRNLKVHIASVNEGNKPFQCNICDASFVEKSSSFR